MTTGGACQQDREAILNILIRTLGFIKSLLEKYRNGEKV